MTSNVDALITRLTNTVDRPACLALAMTMTPRELAAIADQLHVTPDVDSPRKTTLARAVVAEVKA